MPKSLLKSGGGQKFTSVRSVRCTMWATAPSGGIPDCIHHWIVAPTQVHDCFPKTCKKCGATGFDPVFAQVMHALFLQSGQKAMVEDWQLRLQGAVSMINRT